MNDSKNNKLHLSELLIRLLEGTISDEQFADLQHQLSSDPAARRYYLQYMKVSSALSRLAQIGDIEISPTTAENADFFSVLEKLAEYEKDGIPVEVERIKEPVEKVLTEDERDAKIRAFLAEERAIEEQERRLEEQARRRIRERKLQRRRRKQMASMLAAKAGKYVRKAAIAAMLIVVGYLLYAIMHPAPPAFVATLTDGIDIKWADSEKPIQLDSLLRPGSMKLVEGYAQITFDEGARIVLEAPAEINLENSNRAFLQLGKLSAEVPIQSRGFKIDTPSASIVDLGTEFGVKVKEDESTEIHMFKGKASLLPGRKGQTGKGRLVTAGKAMRVKASGLLSDIAFNAGAFVKKISSKSNTVWRGNNIDLADIVGGGDGFGTAEDNMGLNPLTGKAAFALPGEAVEGVGEEGIFVGGNMFTEVVQSKWIDGVFVPDGGEGPVQIAQNGLSFDGFSDTSGRIWTYLQNRKRSFNIGSDDNPNMANKPCLLMHVNLGITFDMDMIRDKFDGQVEIKAFRAKSGFRLLLDKNKADFWVLVDGRVRYKRLGAVATAELDDVELFIAPDDRYLTLATTESDDGPWYDWAMFVSPTLILE